MNKSGRETPVVSETLDYLSRQYGAEIVKHVRHFSVDAPVGDVPTITVTLLVRDERPVTVICEAHGMHPHGGVGVCLDCPDCFPREGK